MTSPTRFSRVTLRSLVAFGLAIAILGSAVGAYAALGGTSRPASSTSVDLQKGLVGWWKMDGDFRDATAYGSNGTGANAPVAVADREGRAPGAYSFNGTNQWVNFGNGPQYKSSNVTMAGWVKPNNVTGYKEILAKEINYKVRLNGTSLEVLIGATGGGWTNSVGFGVGFTAGAWRHVAITIDSTNSVLRAYVDGTQVGAVAITPVTAWNNNPLYAATYNAGGELMNGDLDDLRFYNRAINASEVSALYRQYDALPKLAQGEKGLVGWWKLDGNGKDASPYGNDGTLTSAPAAADRKGDANGALAFNGSTSCVSLPVSASKPYYNPANLTTGAWVKPTASGINRIVRLGLGMDQRYGLAITNGALHYDWWNGTTWVSRATPAVVPLGQWSHVAATRAADNSLNLYVNGVLQFTGTVTSAAVTPAAMSIGSTVCGVNQQFNGSLDDVRIYDRVLSAAEIATQAQSYNSQLSVGNLQKGLVGHWPMNGNAKDATPNANNGVVVGPTLAVDRKGMADRAYSFSDTSNSITVGSPATFSNLATTGFTYSVWLRRPGASTYQWPNIMGATDTHTGYGIRSLSYGDLIGFEYGTAPFGGSTFTSMGIKTLPVNTWALFTVTYDGSTLTAYWDGAFYISSTGVTLNPTFGGLSFSRNTGGWNGVMDDARVYNRALSASEVSALFREYR